MSVELTAHQEERCSQLLEKLKHGHTLLALRGLAGTGKSTVIPFLRARIEQWGLPCRIGAPTHRAASILRTKGIEDAETIHGLCLQPQWTPEYLAALDWCSVASQTKEGGDLPSMPSLLAIYCPESSRADVHARACKYTGTKVLASVGIRIMEHLKGYGPKAPQPGVLLVDEGSMVGEELLSLAQQVYRRIVLIGDHGQLQPVKDVAVLEHMDGVELVDIHRQAAASPIVRIAYGARNGEAIWRHTMTDYAPDIVAYRSIAASTFLRSPLLVWRNATRIAMTHAIRVRLGYSTSALHIGEPLICRSTEKDLRAAGLYNNAQFRVHALHSAREVMLIDDTTGAQVDFPVRVHMEESDGDAVHPDAVVFRYGYAITAHTAQGGEWDHAYVHVPDVEVYSRMGGLNTELPRWLYTVCTRAKTHLGFLYTPRFT